MKLLLRKIDSFLSKIFTKKKSKSKINYVHKDGNPFIRSCPECGQVQEKYIGSFFSFWWDHKPVVTEHCICRLDLVNWKYKADYKE